MNNPDSTVRFKQHWRGRDAGELCSTLDYGVAQLLVQRGVAEWVKDESSQGSIAVVKRVARTTFAKGAYKA